MIAALSILGVVFWVWVIDEVINDDDDDDKSSSAEEEVVTEEVALGEGAIDLLQGLEGDDSLSGGEGVDILIGEEGNDSLRGGDDDDLLLGNEDNDLLIGGDGDDALFGGDGQDTIEGRSGDDIIDGTSQLNEDVLIASAQTAESVGDIVFEFNDAEDTDQGDDIDAGAGDDLITMGSEDSVTGGDGADLFAGGWWIRDGEPAIVEDYDEAEDLLTYTYQGSTEPAITTDVNATTGDATVYADGNEVIVVINAGPSLNANNIVLLQA
ncbi:Hemolysin-type calcium-binding repeat-containing protein [Shimia gijangensis]|uniref:Hemolysin-type calcium-binding repeat-containing protein n=1 Tax=Shimia gijangensis TaxID=1470563 RepID=A0A1M6ES20_9RHOB|nr:hypothetical protein [Shimia gijangensis]SHI88150.1 Hemolysin-type calcium-binding repeat-containing protein [Shimia gijangensis]